MKRANCIEENKTLLKAFFCHFPVAKAMWEILNGSYTSQYLVGGHKFMVKNTHFSGLQF